MKEIFIKGNFPSFKNSKQYVGNGRMIMSRTVQKYLKEYEYEWMIIPKQFTDIKEYPIVVGFHFVRGTKHKFDFHNMVQGCADLIVKHGWVMDDNMDYFIPVPYKRDNKWYSYDKENPGVYIKIMNNE
mgnify:CR=1 FL=1